MKQIYQNVFRCIVKVININTVSVENFHELIHSGGIISKQQIKKTQLTVKLIPVVNLHTLIT
jgi:hypothetical protein